MFRIKHCMQQPRALARPKATYRKFPAENRALCRSMVTMKRIAAACLALCALILCAAPLSAQAAPTQAASAVYPLQDGFVDAHGVLIYYVEFGKGPPLVVLHGGPGADHTYFLPWLLPLARTHRLIFIDERGSGRSERLQDPSKYTVEGDVEDIEAVRVALGLGWRRPTRSSIRST
jgi:hypothetical protein